MKNTKISSLSAAIAGLITTTQAQTWETYPQGGFSPYDVAIHPDGSVAYTAGRESIPGQSFHPSKVRRGDAGGTVWQDVSLPVNCDNVDEVAVASDGTVYLTGVEGRGQLAEGRVWISADGGISWTTIAEFPMGGQMPRDIQVDANGNVFITISKSMSTGNRNLVTYRGTPDVGAPAGIQWTEVDSFLPAGQKTCIPHRLTLRPKVPGQPAEIWVAGHATDNRNAYVPVIRRSLDGGFTWVTVSTWTVPKGYDFASGTWDAVAVADVNGVAYASLNYARKVGKATEYHWLTYRSFNSGVSWALVNDLVAPPSGPSGAAADTLGGVFITGGGVTRASVDAGNNWADAGIAGGSEVAADLVGNVFVGGYTTEGIIYKLPSP